MHAVIGILAALVQRNVTDEGQLVEVAMQEAVLNLTRVRFTGTLTDGSAEQRQTSHEGRRPGSVGGLFVCAPGGPNDYVYLMLPPDNPGMFPLAMGAMGRSDLIEDKRFATHESRTANADELGGIIEKWTAQRDKRTVMSAFAAAGVPCGAVYDTSEVMTDAHLRERETITEISHPTRDTYPMIGCPVRLSDSTVKVTRAPLYSEHSDEIFSTLGGLSQADILELKKAKVII
jgi:formyl-CoA transferase